MSFRMSGGELSFESPPSLRITWNIPDFLKLYTESDNSLQSSEFTFADSRYCLRLIKTQGFYDSIGILLLNVSDTDPGRAVLYEVQLKSRTEEIDMDRVIIDKQIFIFLQIRDLECQKDRYVPEGTLTLLCSLRLRKSSNAGSLKSGGTRTQVIPKCRIRGELSSESPPFLYVKWRIPGYFQLSPKSEYTLESPEFSFCDRRYCLRLFSSGDVDDIIKIVLVNLTDMVPRRYVSYEIGLNSTTREEIDIVSHVASTTRKFYIERYELEWKRSTYFSDGHLTVFCCMRSREPSSAGSPNSGGAGSQFFPSLKDPVPQSATLLKSVGVQTLNKEEDKEGLPVAKSIKRKATDPVEDSILHLANSKIDEIDHLMNFVGKTLKEMEKNKRILLCKKITDLVFEAQLE